MSKTTHLFSEGDQIFLGFQWGFATDWYCVSVDHIQIRPGCARCRVDIEFWLGKRSCDEKTFVSTFNYVHERTSCAAVFFFKSHSVNGALSYFGEEVGVAFSFHLLRASTVISPGICYRIFQPTSCVIPGGKLEYFLPKSNTKQIIWSECSTAVKLDLLLHFIFRVLRAWARTYVRPCGWAVVSLTRDVVQRWVCMPDGQSGFFL